MKSLFSRQNQAVHRNTYRHSRLQPGLWIACLVTVLLTVVFSPASAWDPHAGVIPSYTWKATVTVSSGGNAHLVVDHDENTAWQSAAPLPQGFVGRKDQNFFLHASVAGWCKSSGDGSISPATDGNLNTSATISGKSTFWFEVGFPAQMVHSISLKWHSETQMEMYIFHTTGDSQRVAVLLPSDSYKWKRFPIGTTIKGVKLICRKTFRIFEISAITQPLKENVVLDLGAPKSISWVETRHWAGGKAKETELLASNDLITWTSLAKLNPAAHHRVTTYLPYPVKARYLKVEHTLEETDYAKVFIWEINAWDADGPYGPMPPPKRSGEPLQQLLGINAIWGWGFDRYAVNLAADSGPQKFSALFRHARNFHDMKWDVTDPDIIPDYAAMPVKGTQAMKWLNWDREYQAWKDAGLTIQASIQFTGKTFPQADWENPYRAAYNYGYAIARHFGPTAGNSLIEGIEIGNEPWDYAASFYREVLLGMARGIKEADPAIEVFPCALQSAFPYEERPQGGNFAGARLTEQAIPYIDGLNVHHYSYVQNEKGLRIGIFPEHPQSTLRAIFNDLRFRDANMPGKKIFVTEWGWDSAGAGEDCRHSECVSEQAQALYAVRGALFFIRLGVDRLFWYFFANGTGGLYSRCGLLGSKKTGFAEKQSFRALQALVLHSGRDYFLDVLREDDAAWVYLMGDSAGNPTHLIAWRPVSADDTNTNVIHLPFTSEAESVWLIDGQSAQGTLRNTLVHSDRPSKTMHITVAATPVIIHLKKSGHAPSPKKE
ncbi:MAG: hypothetical protein KatS3mg031_0733 [Chitinophagales bacterium]|nr:MAG: hypothetical protein KatS3mg031_0733 [Chitinophagales bacterium]